MNLSKWSLHEHSCWRAGKRQCGTASEPSEPRCTLQVRSNCCTTVSEGRTENKTSWFFLSKHYNAQNSLGVETCSLFSQICFLSSSFLSSPSNLVFGSSVTLQTSVCWRWNSQGNIIVYILRRNVAAYLQILGKRNIFIFCTYRTKFFICYSYAL